MPRGKTLLVTERRSWRAWLAKHHGREREIWLIFYKTHTGRPRLPYEDAVEEALCYGWIDSLVRRLDDERYARKFTPRKDQSKWSAANRWRVRKLIQEDRMTRAGLAKIPAALLKLAQDAAPPPVGRPRAIPLSPKARRTLMADKAAWTMFRGLAPSYRRTYIYWVMSAKREETRQRRLRELIDTLARGEKLGLK
jgi:uncharacterized protein YdeI (YjbR/CyaY-like superfamily)